MSPNNRLSALSGSLRLFASVALLVAGACTGGAGTRLSQDQQDAIAADVERTLRDAYDLSKPGLTDRMLGLYPPTGRVISANSGSAIVSRDSLEAGIRYFWDNVGVNMRNPRWEWERFWVDVLSPTAAVVTATYRVPHLNPSNQPHVIGGAMTAVLEKQGGRWVILQEHLSDRPSITANDTTPASTPGHDH